MIHEHSFINIFNLVSFNYNSFDYSLILARHRKLFLKENDFLSLSKTTDIMVSVDYLFLSILRIRKMRKNICTWACMWTSGHSNSWTHTHLTNSSGMALIYLITSSLTYGKIFLQGICLILKGNCYSKIWGNKPGTLSGSERPEIWPFLNKMRIFYYNKTDICFMCQT